MSDFTECKELEDLRERHENLKVNSGRTINYYVDKTIEQSHLIKDLWSQLDMLTKCTSKAETIKQLERQYCIGCRNNKTLLENMGDKDGY